MYLFTNTRNSFVLFDLDTEAVRDPSDQRVYGVTGTGQGGTNRQTPAVVDTDRQWNLY